MTDEIESEEDEPTPQELAIINDPTGYVTRMLRSVAKGHELSEDEKSALDFAAKFMCAQMLVDRGISVDSAMKMVDRGGAEVTFTLTEDGLLSVKLDFEPDKKEETDGQDPV